MKCSVFRVRIAASLACAGLAASLAAAQEKPTTPPERLSEVVVTAGRIPEELGKSSISTTIVTREEIEQRQLMTVTDVLRTLPGVDIHQTGQPGGNVAASLRGANGSHTLVLIDGVRVNRPYDNTFNFADLPTENIERIEVLRGPLSTIYGSEAMGGVINIVTRAAAAKPSGAAMIEGGSLGSWRTRESFSARQGAFSLAADGSYFTTDNDRLNSAYDVFNASVRLGWKPSERFAAQFLANVLSSAAGVPNDRFTDDPNDRLRADSQLYALTLTAQPAAWWDARLTLSHGHERSVFNQPAPNPPFFGADYFNLIRSDRDQVDFQSTFALGDWHQVLVGGMFDVSTAHFSAPATSFGPATDFRAAPSSRAVFGQYEFAPHERFSATARGRVDDYSTFGTQATWKFATRHTTPVTETTLRASVGTGFRAPSINDLYYPAVGNPALRAEQSLGWDAGVEQPFLAGKLTLGATLFQNQFKDLIDGFPPVNVGRAHTVGLENSVTWQAASGLTLRAGYTWLTAEDVATGLRLDRRPEHSGNLNVNYAFWKKLNANSNLKISGRRQDKDYSLASAPPYVVTPVANPGYVKWDLALACEAGRNFSIHGRVDNVLGDRYEESFGFPSLARTFWLGATARF